MQHPSVAQLARFYRRCRDPFTLRLIGLLIILLSLPIVHIGLDRARGQASPEIDTRHQVLSQLLGKGQLVVELFPPLSYFLPTLIPAPVFSIMDQSCRLLMLHMAIWSGSALTPLRCRQLGRRALLMGIWVGISLIAWNKGILRQRDSPLEVASSLASCLILLGAMPPRFIPFWVSQILIALAGTIGCGVADWMWCYSLVAIRTVSSIASEDWSRPSHQFLYRTWLVVRAIFVVFWIFCLPLLALLSVYSLLFPYSETSSGGNYNLRFLDPKSRRGLHPEEPLTLQALGLSGHAKNIPRHAVISYLPLSLYVPNAGFLWAEPEDVERPTEESAYFSDPFGRRYPWAVEDAMSSIEGLSQEQREFVQSHVWPGTLVHIRSRIDGRYLGPLDSGDQAENITLKNEVPGLYEQDDNFLRLWVGMHDEPGQQTAWYLEYDPGKDAGFRLYNPHKDCHLATSYLPYGFGISNGTVKEEFQRSYGASCTRSVSTSAATIWIIEGKLAHEKYSVPDQDSRLAPLATWNILSDKFQHGLSIARAHASLYDWYSRFEVKLDMAPSPLSSPRFQDTWGLWFERVVIGGFLAMHGILMLYKQRTGCCASRTVGRMASPAVVLCWSRVLLYNTSMLQRTNSAEVALVMAIGGSLELASENFI